MPRHLIPDAPAGRGDPRRRPPRVVLGPISKRALAWILAPAALLLLLHTFVIGTLHVVGVSMADTLEPGDLVLISKLAVTRSRILGSVDPARSYRPDRGDVVAFRLPQKPSLLLVKRVVGLAGDRVVVEHGALHVRDAGGAAWPDPALAGYARARLEVTAGSLDVVVPRDALFVIGDNRGAGASSDSRDWGCLPSDAVVGRVVLLLHPFARAGPL